jgi:hypothetical protein
LSRAIKQILVRTYDWIDAACGREYARIPVKGRRPLTGRLLQIYQDEMARWKGFPVAVSSARLREDVPAEVTPGTSATDPPLRPYEGGLEEGAPEPSLPAD